MPTLSKPFLGAHLSTAKGWTYLFKEAESIGCACVQIFIKSPRQWHTKPLEAETINEYAKAYQESGIQTVVAHASYLINLATKKPLLSKLSIKGLSLELLRCQQLSIPYLVLHPGSSGGEPLSEAIERIAEGLNTILESNPGNTMILLENSAGQTNAVGSSFEVLAQIRDKITQKERIGFCFDTCHAFAAGYHFGTAAAYTTMIQRFDQILGLENLKVIHLNDSKKELGSHVDRHEDIGTGCIGLEAFELILNDPRFENIPKILETPKKSTDDDLRNLQKVRSLIRTS